MLGLGSRGLVYLGFQGKGSWLRVSGFQGLGRIQALELRVLGVSGPQKAASLKPKLPFCGARAKHVARLRQPHRAALAAGSCSAVSSAPAPKHWPPKPRNHTHQNPQQRILELWSPFLGAPKGKSLPMAYSRV